MKNQFIITAALLTGLVPVGLSAQVQYTSQENSSTQTTTATDYDLYLTEGERKQGTSVVPEYRSQQFVNPNVDTLSYTYPSFEKEVLDYSQGLKQSIAQQQAMTLASDQEIVRLAQTQADDIRNQAQAYERDTRFSAEEYADSVLAHLEDNLKSITSQVGRVRQTLDENAQAGTQNLGW